ncbi:hypothetical protein NX059_008645 [Plenodomus lindquistii]|nr:hypothetical protein NX059_008645 [Plenodomus lindquistii]
MSLLYLLALVSAQSITLAGDSSLPSRANSTIPSIEWSACPPGTLLPKNVQCANFSVPIDWDEPWGEHFDLGIAKLPATPSNTTTRVGSLFINPGGPGESAAQILTGLALGVLPSGNLTKAFDIIGLDPRGVGMSHPIQCNMSIYAERVSLFPQTEEDLEKLVDKNKRLGDSCRELTGPLLEHLDSISVAKDHEAVRVALNDGPMNFLGISYGAVLGAQYAALFPKNVRTIALDSPTLHSQNEASNLIIKTTSYELSMRHFFDWASTNDSSVLKGQNVEAMWNGILANATEKPIPASSCNNTNCYTDVNAEDILFNANQFLTFAGAGSPLVGRSWGVLSTALLSATRGDASALSSPLSASSLASFYAIGCLDWTHETTSLPDILAAQNMLNTYAPFTRGASEQWKFQRGCHDWPVGVKNPPKKLNIKTNATILISTATSDPSTGMAWALGLMEEIENSVLVVRQGDGHTSFSLGGETGAIISDYLVTGKAPKAGIITST